VHVADGEVSFAHLPRQPLNLVPFVAENDGLCYRERIIQIAEGLKFIVLLFDRHKKLLYAIKSQLVSLHENLQRIIHELICHVQNLLRQRR